MPLLYLLTTLFPFVLLFVLLIILQRPAIFSIPLTLAFTILGAALIWKMEVLYFFVAGLKSFLVTLDIMFIIAGVVLLFLILQKVGVFENFENLMTRVSSDRRIQAIIVAWLFVSLLEGTAGFGTPGMLAAGILIHLGFRPLLAVIIPLLGGFVPTTFGAVGVPITIGIQEGVAKYVTPQLIQDVTTMTALFHLILGSFIPLLISCITTYHSSGSFRQGLGIWKFALFSGFAFTVPMFLIAVIFGPEFPSIGGALIALFASLIVIRKKLLLPKTPYRFPHDKTQEARTPSSHTLKTLFKTLIPYVLLVIILSLSRLPFLPLGKMLSSVSITIPSLLQTSVSHSLVPLYSPGFFLVMTALFSVFFFKLPFGNLSGIIKETGRRIRLPFLVLFSTLALVNILLYSENNSADMPSMLIYLTERFSTGAAFWPFLSPLIGMIGAFVSGSVTVSNLLFSSLQYESALIHHHSVVLTLTLQTVGSAAGNMIALHNVIAALSVVHLRHKESSVMRHNLIPTLAYSLGAGLLGFVLGNYVLS